MKPFVLILLPCYFYYVYSAPSENITQITANEPNNNDAFNAHNLLPRSLVESIKNQKEQPRNGRILNENLQHLSSAQHANIPHSTNGIINAASPTNLDISQREIVDLQVPTNVNTNRVLLQLPSQQLPLHNAFVVPPRRHYRITLIRNRKPTPAPQLVNPEVEEKTLIYVLVKKPDETQLEALHNNEQNKVKQNAPEVYFIKYKENNDLSNTNRSMPIQNK